MSTRQAEILFYASLIMITFFAKIAFAFTDMSIEKLDIEMQKIMQQVKQGDRKAAVRFQKALKVLSKIDTNKHTYEEIIARLQDFIKAGKIPSYIFDNRGQYDHFAEVTQIAAEDEHTAGEEDANHRDE